MSEKKKGGFAAMTPEERRRIATLGGRAAQRLGKGHQFTHEEAVAAGRKGGLAATKSGKRHSFTSEEASLAGRKGGRSRGQGKKTP